MKEVEISLRKRVRELIEEALKIEGKQPSAKILQRMEDLVIEMFKAFVAAPEDKADEVYREYEKTILGLALAANSSVPLFEENPS